MLASKCECGPICDFCKFMPHDDPCAGGGVCQNPLSPEHGKDLGWHEWCDAYECRWCDKEAKPNVVQVS